MNSSEAQTKVDIQEEDKQQITIKAEQKIPDEIKRNQSIYYEYFDINYTISVAKFLLSAIEKHYFRAKLVGFDENDFPERNNPDRPLIFASNHSGMSFPWDAIIFATALFRAKDYDVSKAIRALTSPMLSKTRMMSPFLINHFWKRLGAIDATTLNFETMMYSKESNIMIYPEGVPGIGKGFNHRYELQRLSTSALRMSLKYKTDIVPIATINAEYINPFTYSQKVINKLVNKVGMPFLPLGLTTFLMPVQPWAFYFALPAKLTFVRGKRIKPYEMIDKPFEEISKQDLYDIRDKIHAEMQIGLDKAVSKYGKNPYNIPELVMEAIKNSHKLLYFSPIAWPFLFIEHEKRYKRRRKLVAKRTGIVPNKRVLNEEAQVLRTKDFEDESVPKLIKKAVGTIIRNPEVLIFYVPFLGWAPAMLKGRTKKKKKRFKLF